MGEVGEGRRGGGVREEGEAGRGGGGEAGRGLTVYWLPFMPWDKNPKGEGFYQHWLNERVNE